MTQDDFIKEADDLWKKNAGFQLEYIINGKRVLIQKWGKYFQFKIDGEAHRVYGRQQWKVYYPREVFITRKYQNSSKWKEQTKHLDTAKYPINSDKIIIKHLNEEIIIQRFGDIIRLLLGKDHQLWTSLTFSEHYHIEKMSKETMKKKDKERKENQR